MRQIYGHEEGCCMGWHKNGDNHGFTADIDTVVNVGQIKEEFFYRNGKNIKDKDVD